MDPKSHAPILLAPPADGSGAARFPGRAPLPSPDEHIVVPELTRDEVIRGRRVVAMPALPPHAERQAGLGYVIVAHVKEGYVGAAELLTRVNEGSDFATDVCVRREGNDPATGTRYLEELSFEVVNEQRPRDIREKAEDLTARGVRRVVAVFVKTGKVCEWSRAKGDWEELDSKGVLDDPCLRRPVQVRALLDAAAADDEVARALMDKHNPVIEALRTETFRAGRDEGRHEGRHEGKALAILDVLAARGVVIPGEVKARVLACRDAAALDRWIARAVVAASADEVIAGEG